MSDHTAEGVAGPDWVVWLPGASVETGVAIRRHALSLGRSVFDVDAGTVQTTHELVAGVSRGFLVPHDVRGFDALLSALSDLDWLANENGYLFVLNGLTELRHNNEDLFNRLVRILPHLCDRWRARSTPFQIVLHTDRATVDSIEALVAGMYAEYRASKWRSDFAEVPVIDVEARCGGDA